jgi:hypothetical protein
MKETDTLLIFENLSRKFKLRHNLARITSVLLEDVCTFITISRSVLRRTKKKFQKNIVEKIKIYFMFKNFFFESRALYEIMWKTVVEPDHT